jgi:hypothetical protein
VAASVRLRSGIHGFGAHNGSFGLSGCHWSLEVMSLCVPLAFLDEINSSR